MDKNKNKRIVCQKLFTPCQVNPSFMTEQTALPGDVWFALLGDGVAAVWPRASLVCGVFPLGSSLETKQSLTYCSLVFRVGLSEFFVSHGITH